MNTSTQRVFKALCTPILAALIVVGCASNDAEALFKQHNYIGSIEAITKDLNQRQSYPSASTKQRWMTLVNQSIEQIEAMPQISFEQQTRRLELLLKARTLLDQGFYRTEFASFTERYQTNELKNQLAKLYYDWGQSITGNDQAADQKRAQVYGRGAALANYKNMQKLAEKYQLSYDQSVAKSAYERGVMLEREQNHQAASEAFKEALNAYQAHGNYKDASQRFRTNDQKWRKARADQAIMRAKSIEQSSDGKKVGYRQMAKAYQEAADIYQPYGDYQGSKGLANQYRNLGTVRYNYRINAYSGNAQCGFYGNRVSDQLGQMIQNTVKGEGFTYGANPDWMITINYTMDYQDQQNNQDNQIESYVDQAGKEWRYNRTTTSRAQAFTIRATIESRGLVNDQQTVGTTLRNQQTRVQYSGNVPAHIKGYTNGQFMSQEALCEAAERDIRPKINSVIERLANEARQR
ncbi:hypothetical protein [Wohlfahrtiimonas chitiniclastica]|uniref:hypothetical protein n=1 Tax=Wohlfahrtiimonas chitiniclastica TaxID=400946 RepID=UPI001BCD7170|nr:hypothetical protein [Wohlfahrtiimonas chitiniclastica]MBS7816835.1 hypothetical protein [Wohlfahrtiimonas chitiniclastica]MBS7822272.1 hypothetical protein [Wohlfahrtiimonas chitiniclastica]MBS7830334.1 hypothetical protein [Wohlfahrtiimonas chitiniclastica]MBS7832302.1 hypothetical protein [Wohlfahrtiimonas chitiniclastica]